MYSRSDLHTWYSFHNILGRHDGFRFADIGLSVGLVQHATRVKCQSKYAPEQELTIEIADIDGVHVDDVNILEPCQRKVG